VLEKRQFEHIGGAEGITLLTPFLAAQKSERSFSTQGRERENAKVAGEETLVAGMAGRYAIALFDLALDEDKIEEIEGALDRIDVLLRESPEFARLVRSPVFTAEEQARSLSAIAAHSQITGLTANFLQLLVKNRRLFALRDIIAGFRRLLADHRGEVTAEVVSAIALTEAQSEELKATLKAKTGKTVSLNLTIDPAIIGGLIVKIGSRMVDTSIRTKLNTLKFAMKEVG
jgi:F-type H+-transporting ATPase subunit delta